MTGRAPDPVAPFCASCRDMSPNHRRIKHLHQMRRLAQARERLEKRLEDPGIAQPPEPLPHRVPRAELRRQSPPRDIVKREIMKRFEKLTIVASPRRERTASNTCRATAQSSSVICVSMVDPAKPTRYESPINHFGNPLTLNFIKSVHKA